MVVASLVVSVVSLLVAIASVAYARRTADAADRSAKAADDSAQAAEGSLAIEAARRLEERRPRLGGKIKKIKGTYELWVTLESDERLSLLELRIASGQGVSFTPNADGVETPPGANAAWCAFSHYGGEPDSMDPRDTVTWPVEVKRGLTTGTIQVEATCHGEQDELWESVLIQAPIVLPDRST
jgi:hypothetical protein